MLLTVFAVVAAAVVAVSIHRRTNWLWFISRQFKPVAPGSYILITGCDTGFGRLSAERLSSAGFHVLAGCLQDASIAELNKLPNVTAFKFDVTSEADRRRCIELIEKQCPNKLGAVINNAGISDGFIAEWTDVATYRRVMEVNFFAAVAISNACLPFLRRTGGRVLNVSSVAGFLASYAMAAYAASKHALAAYSEVLRQEAAPSGVSVSLIMPGFARTNILAVGADNVQRCAQNASIELTQPYPRHVLAGTIEQLRELQRHGADPKYTVDAIEHAITSPYPKARYVVGADGALLRLLNMLPSAILDRILFQSIARGISKVTQA